MKWRGKSLPDLMQLLRREIFYRRQPHGLISWRYLLPRQNHFVRLHRHFWWNGTPNIPRPIWIIIELLLYLRWICWEAWRASWKSVQWYLAANTCELSRFTLLLFALRMALGRCFPPGMALHLQLYRPQVNSWTYVTTAESAAFHRWRDKHPHPVGLTRLSDKWECNQRLATVGVAVTKTLMVLPNASLEPDWTTFPSPIFLKPRNGHGGQHCYSLTRDQHGQHVWKELARSLESDASYSKWRQGALLYDFLIQPCYRNAHVFSDLSEEVITLRVLTKRLHTTVEIDLAYLEIPDGVGHYVMQAVDLQNGQLIFSDLQTDFRVKDRWHQDGIAALPLWQQAAQSARLAHQTLAMDLFSVAWDFVLTDEGALMLEGNGRWAIQILQWVNGGLLEQSAT